jgi:2-C-methyl-D-erythritol 4-phosphate cytidylyltransferase
VNGISSTCDRKDYQLVQTPQTFQTALIKKAYAQPYQDSFTDDAIVFEKDGNPLVVFDGDRENIKITWPLDLDFAEAVVKRQAMERKDLENRK